MTTKIKVIYSNLKRMRPLGRVILTRSAVQWNKHYYLEKGQDLHPGSSGFYPDPERKNQPLSVISSSTYKMEITMLI